ncbi:MAG: protein translocase subunit SecF [Rhodospirillales bacterium]|nr:MAG: protein translocase subunit SecF [Rhodospirillales bacterium]
MRTRHLFSDTPSVDFVGKRLIAYGLSLLVLAVGALSLGLQGLNLGIDFDGGVLMEVRSVPPVDVATVRSRIAPLDLGEVAIQDLDAAGDVLIRIERPKGGESAYSATVAQVRQALGTGFEVRRVDVVGPSVGREFFIAGITATLAAVMSITVYVVLRFEWQFGVAALMATFHDVLATVGLLSILRLDFDLTAVAALLTLAGYSINDTIVVFDRIRETLRRYKRMPMADVVNVSVNATLKRTVLTSGMTLAALLPLALMGGPALTTFSLTMVFGIVIGTFSSVYVAGALLLHLPPVRPDAIGGNLDAPGDAPPANLNAPSAGAGEPAPPRGTL